LELIPVEEYETWTYESRMSCSFCLPAAALAVVRVTAADR